ncbi:MAG: hypothetical protein ABEK59_05690 [Halobacteria archaeon]
MEVENLGGIESDSFVFNLGVNILTGPNSSNKTSVLEALSCVLGGSKGSLRAEADNGCVKLEVGEDNYVVEFERHNGKVVKSGETYLENAGEEELFGFLLEDNPPRVAAEKGENLYDVMMDPINTNEIEREKRRQIQKKETKQKKIREIEEKKSKIPEHKERLEEVESRKQKKKTELEDIEEEITEKKEKLRGLKEESNEKRERKHSDMLSKKSEHEKSVKKLESRMESLKSQIEAKTENLEKKKKLLSDIEKPDAKVRDKRKEIEELKNERLKYNDYVSTLERQINVNRDMVEEDVEVISRVIDGTRKENLGVDIDGLFGDGSGGNDYLCWGCGRPASREVLEEFIEDLVSIKKEKEREKREIGRKIEMLEEEVREFEDKKQRFNDLEKTVSVLENEIQSLKKKHEDRREVLQEEKERLRKVEEELEKSRRIPETVTKFWIWRRRFQG